MTTKRRTVHVVEISKAGQQHNFQIPVPRDAICISGIKASIKALNQSQAGSNTSNQTANNGDQNNNVGVVQENPQFAFFTFNQSYGILSLTVPGEEQEFYATPLQEGEHYLVWDNDPYWTFEPYEDVINGRIEDRYIKLSANQTILQAVYRDFMLAQGNITTPYEVRVYVEYQIVTP